MESINTKNRISTAMQIVNPFFLISLAVTLYVAVATPNTEGTFLYFTIPMSFCVCSVFFKDIIAYHKDGFGLKIFYGVVIARYLLLPVMTCSVGTFAGGASASPSAYRYAILMTDIELIVSCIVIKKYYKKEYDRISKTVETKRSYYDGLSMGGLFFVIASFFLMYTRGFEELLASMRFLVISEKLEDETLYSYDVWLAHTLLAFFVVFITSYFKKRNDKNPSVINTVLPLAFTFLSCTLCFGNNRMMIVYYALSGLMVLFHSFPKNKKMFTAIIVPALLVVLISFTMLKQYSVDVTGVTREQVGEDTVTSTITSYVCGIENIAKSYDRYQITGKDMQMFTLFADILKNTKVFGLPVLSNIPKLVSDVPTSVDLATMGTEMVSVAGQTLFYGGYELGWLLDILAFYVIIRLLIKFDVNAKVAKSTGTMYIYTWLAILFGMTMCYCLETLYANVTYVPFFVLIAVAVNRLPRKDKQEIEA